MFDFSRYGAKPIVKSYIHNNYYWFVHRLGFVGLGLFIWLMAAFLVPWMRHLRSLPRDDPWLRGLVIGGRAVAVVLLVNSITSPRLDTKVGVSVLALMMGMSEVALVLLLRRRADEALERELEAADRAALAAVSSDVPAALDSPAAEAG